MSPAATRPAARPAATEGAGTMPKDRGAVADTAIPHDRPIGAGRTPSRSSGHLPDGPAPPACARALRLSRLAERRGRPDAQFEQARRAAEAWRPEATATLLACVNALLACDHPGIVPLMERLVRRWPEEAAPLYGQARIATRDGDRALALARIDEAVELAPDAWGYHQLVLDLLLADRPESRDVEDALAEIEARWSGRPQARVAQARVALARHRPLDALDAAERVDPPTAASLAIMSRALVRLNRLDDALAVARTRIALLPDALNPRLEEARLLALLDRPDGDEAPLLEFLARRPDVAARLALGERLEAAGRLEEAEAAMRDLPRTARVRARLWPVWARMGADATLLEDAERTPSAAMPPPAAILLAAQHLVRGGRGRTCAALLSRVMDVEPENGRVDAGTPDPALLGRLLELVRGFATVEEIEDWVERLGRALPFAPGTRVVARALRHAGRTSEAMAVLRRIPTAERVQADVTAIGQMLNALHRRRASVRYLSIHARRWPRAVQALVGVYITHGDMAAARALVENVDPSRIDHANRRRLAINLGLQTGTVPLDVALLEENERLARGTLIQPIMLETMARGDVDLAEAAEASQFAIEPDRRKHWRASQVGQLMADLRAARASVGAERLRTLREGPVRELADMVVAHPRIYAFAAMLTSRIGPSGGSARAGGFRAPGPERGATSGALVPPRVHQYWNDDPAPGPVRALVASWAGVPGVSHELLSRRAALEWLREVGPDWARAFRLANNPAEEADFLRLCVLWRRGGIWADADDALLGSIDPLLSGRGLVVFQEPMGNAIANNVIAAAARHPVIAFAAAVARHDLLARSNESTWQKTGPGLLTRAVAQYAARCIVTRGTVPPDLHILPQPLLRREVGIHTRLPHKASETYWNSRRSADPGFRALLDRLVARWEARHGRAQAERHGSSSGIDRTVHPPGRGDA